MSLTTSLVLISGPSGSPTFVRSKISTLSTGLDVYWNPPPASSINGEFLGYILTFRKEDNQERTRIEIRDESFKTQVGSYALNDSALQSY